MERIKTDEKRNPDGTFAEGTAPGPGRPKGKTIKERVKDWLEEHPEDMNSFVEHFVRSNRDLAWQMLEGRPSQATDITSAGQPIIQISSDVATKHALDESTVGNS